MLTTLAASYEVRESKRASWRGSVVEHTAGGRCNVTAMQILSLPVLTDVLNCISLVKLLSKNIYIPLSHNPGYRARN